MHWVQKQQLQSCLSIYEEQQSNNDKWISKLNSYYNYPCCAGTVDLHGLYGTVSPALTNDVSMMSQDSSEEIDSTSLKLRIRNPRPRRPTKVRECSEKSSDMLTLKWSDPSASSHAAVHHYEVYMMNKEGVFNNIGDVHDCSCTVDNLSQNTEYTFRICSVSEDGLRSSFGRKITVQTKSSRLSISCIPTVIFAVFMSLALLMHYLIVPFQFGGYGAIVYTYLK